MIPVKQTVRMVLPESGYPEHLPPEKRGDCYRACLASILEVPIEDLPKMTGESVRETLDRENEVVRSFGFWIYSCEWAGWEWDIIPGDAWWIASVPSLNLGVYPDDGRPIRHAVVARGRYIVHDPSLDTMYDAETFLVAESDPLPNEAQVLAGSFLVPIDPAADR